MKRKRCQACIETPSAGADSAAVRWIWRVVGEIVQSFLILAVDDARAVPSNATYEERSCKSTHNTRHRVTDTQVKQLSPQQSERSALQSPLSVSWADSLGFFGMLLEFPPLHGVSHSDFLSHIAKVACFLVWVLSVDSEGMTRTLELV
jgi:hypothetical protein